MTAPQNAPSVPVGHACDPAARWMLRDARGIPCCYVCRLCEARKRAGYRAEVFTDPNYAADEPIEGDDW